MVSHTKPARDGQEIAAELDLSGLKWIHRFGSLRPVELGRLLWPKAKHQRKQAEHLVRRWVREGYVLQRVLPRREGTALVLSEAGAKLLRQAGESAARSGKDWGRLEGGGWWPPQDYVHQLMAAGVMSLLATKGLAIVPEAELRRAGRGQSKKWPDGLAVDRQGVGWWVEVENARKTGTEMQRLVQQLERVTSGCGPTLDGQTFTRAMIVLDPHSRDRQMDFFLDHRQRITAAIKRTCSRDVPIVWVFVSMGPTKVVSSYTTKSEIIESDEVAKLLSRLSWKEEDGILAASENGKTGATWKAESGGGWCWTIEKNGVVEVSELAKNVTQAKRRIAEMLNGES